MLDVKALFKNITSVLATPITYDSKITYTELNSGWTPSKSGFITFMIEPSNTSNANAYIRDVTANIDDVCKLASTGGTVNSCTVPVIGGHQYKIRTSTSNVQVDARCYGYYFPML